MVIFVIWGIGWEVVGKSVGELVGGNVAAWMAFFLQREREMVIGSRHKLGRSVERLRRVDMD